MTTCRHHHQPDPPNYRRRMVNCRWMVPLFSLFMLLCVRVQGFIHNNNPGIPFRRFCTTTTTTTVDDRISRNSHPLSSVSSIHGIPLRSPALYPGITSFCCRYYNINNNNIKPFLTRLNDKLNNNNEEYANNDDDELLVDDEEDVFQLVADFRGRPAGVVIEDLNWRVHKLRLEEANTRRFLKAGPRFLPYEECRKWVQAWGNRWQSATEWENWIAAGEKRNSYIPSRPEEYFTRTGDWISWAHFLGVEDESSSAEENETDKER